MKTVVKLMVFSSLRRGVGFSFRGVNQLPWRAPRRFFVVTACSYEPSVSYVSRRDDATLLER